MENDGNMPTRKSEVKEPVTFAFGPEAKLLCQPKILRRKPENLGAEWEFLPSESTSWQANQAILSFDLLNQGKQLTIVFLCSGKSNLPRVSARIEGISKIEIRPPKKGVPWKWILVGVSLASVIGMGAFVIFKVYSFWTRLSQALEQIAPIVPGGP